MPRTITLTDITIIAWTVNVRDRYVQAAFFVCDAEGSRVEEGVARFWETLPDMGEDEFGNPRPMPDNWYQLPPAYAQLLTDLTVDMRGALLHLINE